MLPRTEILVLDVCRESGAELRRLVDRLRGFGVAATVERSTKRAQELLASRCFDVVVAVQRTGVDLAPVLDLAVERNPGVARIVVGGSPFPSAVSIPAYDPQEILIAVHAAILRRPASLGGTA